MAPYWLLCITLAVSQAAGPAPAPAATQTLSAIDSVFSPQVPDPAPGSADSSLASFTPEGVVGMTEPAGQQPAAPAKEAEKQAESTEPKRRSPPSPWSSPPFPGSEYQGYPLIGVPVDTTRYFLMQSLQGTWIGDLLDSQRIRAGGWVTVEGNVSSSKHSNTPDSYWIRPNNVDMDQAVFRLERQADTVQTDHIDYGFRSTVLYGIDYRYMTAGGWTSDQLLKHNNLYGVDFTEQYLDVYVPWVAQGMIVRVGRWIACPDIETQFAPDNYMGSHSLLFTFDSYTVTGVMLSFKLSDQWEVQGAITAGTDMAPWYAGAIPTGFVGIRWVSKENSDAVYTCLNQINNARFRRFEFDGQPFGHDNFNYIVSTWEHRFNPLIHTKTEAYYMWQTNAVLGGTPSLGPLEPFGSGGGIGTDIPGISRDYGAVNFTMFATSPKSFITVRNEIWRDEEGERTGFPGTYTSNAVGFTYNFTRALQIRPEVGYYRNWNMPAFDLGTKHGEFMAGLDMTLRF
jgi:putative OmpL-like beta-barrel porin-2